MGAADGGYDGIRPDDAAAAAAAAAAAPGGNIPNGIPGCGGNPKPLAAKRFAALAAEAASPLGQ